MSKVVIFGTGAFAEVVHTYLSADSPHEVVAFTVHREQLAEPQFCGLPVVPYEDVAQSHPPNEYEMFVAVGYRKVNQIRAEIYADAKAKGYRLISYVSPRCTQIGEIPIGDNCFIFEDNTLQPFARIGNNVIMWSGNHIGHHSRIGDHCFITSHAVISGFCEIGDYCFIGINAALRDNIKIAESTVVGAGALIMKSTRPKQVYIAERTRHFGKSSDEINL